MLVVFLSWIALQFSSVQSRATSYVLDSFSEKYNTELSVGEVDIDFFRTLRLKDVYIEDQQRDTLAYIGDIEAKISLFSIWKKNLEIASVTATKVRVDIHDHDGVPNYDFLIPKSDGKKKSSETTSGLAWDLSTVKLIDTDVRYRDSLIKVHCTLEFGHLDIADINTDSMQFSLDDALLRQLNIDIANKPSKSTGSSSLFPILPFEIDSDRIAIKNSSIRISRDGYTSTRRRLDTDDIDVHLEALTLEDLAIVDDSISGKLHGKAIQERGGLVVKDIHSDVLLSEKRLRFKDTKILTPLSRLNITGDFEYDSWVQFLHDPLRKKASLVSNRSTLHKKDIDYLRPYLPKGIEYGEIESIVLNGRINLRNRTLKTKGLKLAINDIARMELDFDARNFPHSENMLFQYTLQSGHVKPQKLARLIPTFSLPRELDSLSYVDIYSAGSGRLSDIRLDTLSLTSGKKISIQTKGKLRNVTNTDSLTYELDKVSFRADTRWIPLTPSLRRYQEKLHTLSYRGKLNGSLTSYDIDGRITTPLGTSDTDLRIKTDPSYSTASYKGKIALDNFMLDELLDDPSFGRTSLTLDVDGSGIDQESLKLSVKGKVDDVTYNYHSYKNIHIDGNIEGISYKGIIESKEDGTVLRYDGVLDFNPDSAQYQTSITLDSMDLYRLNLVNRPLTISGDVHSDLKGGSYEELEGEIRWDNIRIIDAKASYDLKESAIVQITNDAAGKTISVRSPFADVDMESDISIDQLYAILINYLDTHVPINLAVGEVKPIRTTDTKNNTLKITSTIKEINPFLGALTEDDIYLKGGTWQLDYDRRLATMDLKMDLDSLHYNNYAFHGAQVSIAGTGSELQSEIRIAGAHRNGKEVVPTIWINSTGKDRILNTVIDAKDEDHIPRIMLGSQISDDGGVPLIQFHDSLIINKERWRIAKNNALKLSKDDLIADNLEVFRNNQSIRLETVAEASSTGLKLTIDQFRIDEINKILSRGDKRLNGKINGSIHAHDIYDKIYITSDLKVNDLIYNEKEVGNLSLKAKQDKSKNNVFVNFDLIGKENDALGQMTYDIDKQRFDGFLELAKLEMRLVDPFVKDIIEESTGHLYGDFKIEGTLDKPDLSGNLLFDEASTVIKATKTRYKISDQKVRFNKRTIQFDGVKFTDTEGRSAIVNGNIRHRNFRDMYVSLEADSEGMQVLNTTSEDNSFLYGKIYLNTNLNIYGPPEKLKVEGFATAVNNSEIFMSPFSETETLITDDFIIFSPPKGVENDSIVIEYASEEKFPVDVNVSLIVEEDAKFHFIVNPVTGDKLQAQGNANLQIGLKKDGDVQLFGNYVAEDGFYLFSYGPIQRKFNIVKGGTVTFNGDPLAAKLNINAINDVKVAPYELLKAEVSDSDKYKYTQRTDVDVVLGLSGNMLSPEIKLDIKNGSHREDEVSKALEQKLATIRSNPNELNNQVFGLLMLETFISVDNTISGFDATENIILGSVSSLISSQLNNLTKGIKDVNISFDVQNYSKESQSGGTDLVTEMNVGVSRNLFNDRITIRAGGNFDLESGSGDSKFSRIAGDFVIEWKLNEEGNYLVKIFNRSDYNRVDENQNKTGVSFSVKKNLD